MMKFVKKYMCCCFVKRWIDAGSINVIKAHEIKPDINKSNVNKSNVNVMIDDGRVSELSNGSL